MSSDNHNKHYVNEYGEEVLRISQVIKTLAKDQLIMWAHMLGWKRINYQQELDRTANIGTFAHAMIEQYYSDHEICCYDFDDCEQEAYNAAESFFKWLKKNERVYKVVATEKTLIGKNVGGTIDCVIESPYNKDRVILIDYKTSSRIHFTHFLQLSGYVTLYEEIYGPNTIDGIMVIRLDKKDGKSAEAKIIRRNDLEPYIECFKSLLTVATLSKALEHQFPWDAEKFTAKDFD